MTASRLTDRDLEVAFIDKEALAEARGAFMLTSYAERLSTYEGKSREESVFTVYLIEGPERGIEQLLTLGVTEPRRKVGKLVQQASPRGPVTLEKQKLDKQGRKRKNALYVFRPVTDPEVIKLADRLAHQLAHEGLDTSDESDDTDE